MNEYRDPSKYPRENPVTIQCREIFNTASIARETIQGENNLTNNEFLFLRNTKKITRLNVQLLFVLSVLKLSDATI